MRGVRITSERFAKYSELYAGMLGNDVSVTVIFYYFIISTEVLISAGFSVVSIVIAEKLECKSI